MSETNTIHHHFRLDYLFDIKTTKSIDRNKIVFDDEREYDFIGRSSDNYGIQGKVGHLGYEPNAANTFSLVQVGESRCLFRENPWYASQNIFILKPLFPELVDVQLYITCVLNKSLEIYKEAYKYPTLSVLKGIEIQLPVSCNGSPDWDYMQARITELEQERIAELEQFLIASGLNDYELNDIDKKVLIKRVETIPFCIHKLFCKKTIKGYPKSKENLQENQNGYFVYGQNIKRQHPHKILLDDIYLHKIDPNHPILAYTSSVGEIGMIDESFYRSGDNGAFQGLLPRYKSYTIDETLYILASLGKQFKGFDYSTSMKNINDLEFSLPIQTNEEGTPIIDPERKYHAEGYIPDWDYMTSYIRAMKKVVIADVVKYKDEVIAKTRSLVSVK